MNLFGTYFRLTLGAILALYCASFLSFLFPILNTFFFFTLALLTLVLTLKKFEYGLFILLAEIFIGSKGYLFFVETGGARMSLRMALFIIVVAAWLGYLVREIKNQKSKIKITVQNVKLRIRDKKFYFLFSIFYFLLLAIIWGVINGFLRGNSFPNIFHDANAWAYFILIPIFTTYNLQATSYKLIQIFLAAVSAMVVKSFVLLYLFSHEFFISFTHVYPWLRKFLLAEITVPEGGWPRIFFQSQIFVLIGFFVLLALAIASSSRRLSGSRRFGQDSDSTLGLLAMTSGALATVLMSFSRSFWVGLVAGFVAMAVIAFIFIRPFKNEYNGIKSIVSILGVTVMALAMIMAVVYFPIPKSIGVDLVSVLSNRLTDVSEAAVRSRWDLLPPLWKAVQKHLILGSGFGTTVTYKSSDPRALEISPNGMFTTYSFEWGYFDLWLKLGLFGLVAYLSLLVSIFCKVWLVISNFKLQIAKQIYPFGASPEGTFSVPEGRENPNNQKLELINPSTYQPVNFGLILGLFVLVVVHFFSPYLNHPLGIVYVLLVWSVMVAFKNEANPVRSPEGRSL